jgi:hypothetical protein
MGSGPKYVEKYRMGQKMPDGGHWILKTLLSLK